MGRNSDSGSVPQWDSDEFAEKRFRQSLKPRRPAKSVSKPLDSRRDETEYVVAGEGLQYELNARVRGLLCVGDALGIKHPGNGWELMIVLRVEHRGHEVPRVTVVNSLLLMWNSNRTEAMATGFNIETLAPDLSGEHGQRLFTLHLLEILPPK